MITNLIYFGVPVLVFIAILLTTHNNWGVGFMDVLFGAMMSFVSFVGLLILTAILTVAAPQEFIFVNESSIYAIEFNSTVSGNFFLGSGSFSSKENYYYIGEYKEGKKIYNVSQNRAYIVEDNNISPSVEVYETQFKNKWLRKNIPNCHTREEYKFIIPENSIKYDYNIDLKDVGK